MISLTPLIDVVFILLVFFMLASSFVDWRAIEVAAPTAARSGGAAQEATLVEIGRQGVTLRGEALALDELTGRLVGERARRPDHRVLVRTENGVTLETVVAVLDRLTAAGVTDLTFLANPER